MKSVNINGINLKSEVKINIPGSYPLAFKTRLNRLFREIIGLRVDHLIIEEINLLNAFLDIIKYKKIRKCS
jgi:hypothetical protein